MRARDLFLFTHRFSWEQPVLNKIRQTFLLKGNQVVLLGFALTTNQQSLEHTPDTLTNTKHSTVPKKKKNSSFFILSFCAWKSQILKVVVYLQWVLSPKIYTMKCCTTFNTLKQTFNPDFLNCNVQDYLGKFLKWSHASAKNLWPIPIYILNQCHLNTKPWFYESVTIYICQQIGI